MTPENNTPDLAARLRRAGAWTVDSDEAYPAAVTLCAEAAARLSLTEQVVDAARAALGYVVGDAAYKRLATTLEALDPQPSEKEETP